MRLRTSHAWASWASTTIFNDFDFIVRLILVWPFAARRHRQLPQYNFHRAIEVGLGRGDCSITGLLDTKAPGVPTVEALRRTGANDSFWVVLVPGPERMDGYPANLQFSIEDGSVGMDWVLAAESNIHLREKFLSVVADEGLALREVERNGVRYIRATGEKDWATVAERVLIRMFGSERTTRMPLIITGFEWRKT